MFRYSQRIRRFTVVSIAVLTIATTSCGSDREGLSADAAVPTTTARPATASGDEGRVTFPVTVESCGIPYTFEAPPEKVLIGWPQSIETLMALGVEDESIGYFSGSLSDLPDGAPDIPEISPDFIPSREAVVAAGADLVLLNDFTSVAGDSGGVSQDDLEAAGTNVFVLGDYCGNEVPAPTSTDVVLDDLRDLGAIFGVPERAEERVAEVESRLAAAATGDGQQAAFIQIVDGTVYALGGSYQAALLDAIGLENSFADLEGSFSEISAEEVLVLSPEVVLVVFDELSTDANAAVVEVERLLAGSPAVEQGLVLPVTYSAIAAGGVTLIDLIEDVAGAL